MDPSLLSPCTAMRLIWYSSERMCSFHPLVTTDRYTQIDTHPEIVVCNFACCICKLSNCLSFSLFLLHTQTVEKMSEENRSTERLEYIPFRMYSDNGIVENRLI